MISITKFLQNINEYVELGKANLFPVKYGCQCGYLSKLHRHGFYTRNAITRFSTYRVVILRVKCPSCNKTYSLLPSFLIPYRQYTFDVVFLCLYQTYLGKSSYQRIVTYFREKNPATGICAGNIYSFKKRMREVAPLVNAFFANYDDLYYEMDAPTVQSVTRKIQLFLETRGDFNYDYFDKMPCCFFVKT